MSTSTHPKGVYTWNHYLMPCITLLPACEWCGTQHIIACVSCDYWLLNSWEEEAWKKHKICMWFPLELSLWSAQKLEATLLSGPEIENTILLIFPRKTKKAYHFSSYDKYFTWTSTFQMQWDKLNWYMLQTELFQPLRRQVVHI